MFSKLKTHPTAQLTEVVNSNRKSRDSKQESANFCVCFAAPSESVALKLNVVMKINSSLKYDTLLELAQHNSVEPMTSLTKHTLTC